MEYEAPRIKLCLVAPLPPPPALGANPSITNNGTVSCFVHNLNFFYTWRAFLFLLHSAFLSVLC